MTAEPNRLPVLTGMRICSIEGCGRPAGVPGTARGLCSMHYSRRMRNGSAAIRTTKVRQRDLPCVVEGCDRPRAGRGLCAPHWMQRKRRGDPVPEPIRGRLWTPAEDRRLIELPRHPKSGMIDAGYLADAALILERTEIACRSRLHKLRREGRA